MVWRMSPYERRRRGARGVSLNAEMIHRLEQSFAEEKSFYAPFGKLETFLVAQLLATAIQTIEAKTGKNWMDDVEAFLQTQEACKTVLDAFRPPDFISKGQVAAESSTVGTDAATKALISEFREAAARRRPEHPAAKFFRMKKKGG